MSKIPLSIKYTGEITYDDISILVDNQLVSFTVSNNIINVDLENTFGIHLLKLNTFTNNKFEIEKVLINGCDLRKLLFLSWTETVDKQRVQPSTGCWAIGQAWILPFGNPLSYWIDLVEKKIINSAYGTNLDEDYWFFYPTSTSLSNCEFPTVINDFFQHNFDFTAVCKSNYELTQIPYMKYTKDISDNLMNLIANEIQTSIDYIEENKSPYMQYNLNKEEFGATLDNKEWSLLLLHHQTANDTNKLKYLDHLSHFPAIQKLLEFLDMKYWLVFIGILPAGGLIYPHLDDTHTIREDYADFHGCTALYIPIKWEPGNYIKFAGAGIPDIDSGPMVINTDSFTHAIVNASNQDRYVLVIRCDKSIVKDCVISSTY